MDVPIEIERVDITSDDALFTRYAIRIPVIEAAGEEFDAAGADDAALRRWIGGVVR